MEEYKVSVITPTKNRPEMLDRMKNIFLSQDYVDKEWIIIADESDYKDKHSFDLIYGISGDWFCENGTIGHKRNFANELCLGKIILHMDDDDIYAPDWISKSVSALIGSHADIVGLSSCYFHKVDTGNIFEYSPQSNQLYMPEATLCYWRKTWERRPFKDTSAGEGLDFLANGGRLFAHGYKEGFLATIHGGNTHSHGAIPIMKKVPESETQRLLKHFYNS